MLVSAMSYHLRIWLIKKYTFLLKKKIIIIFFQNYKKYVKYAYNGKSLQSGQHNL